MPHCDSTPSADGRWVAGNEQSTLSLCKFCHTIIVMHIKPGNLVVTNGEWTTSQSQKVLLLQKKKLIDFSLNLNFPYDMKSHSLFNATLGMMAHSTPRTENIGIIFHIQYWRTLPIKVWTKSMLKIVKLSSCQCMTSITTLSIISIASMCSSA